MIGVRWELRRACQSIRVFGCFNVSSLPSGQFYIFIIGHEYGSVIIFSLVVFVLQQLIPKSDWESMSGGFFFSSDILHHANIDSFFQCSVPLWKQFTSISLKFKARSWTLTPAIQYQVSLSMTFGASLRMRTTIHFRFHSQNCLQRRCPETSVKIENRLQSIDRSTTATTGTVRRPLRGQQNFRSHKVELSRS